MLRPVRLLVLPLGCLLAVPLAPTSAALALAGAPDVTVTAVVVEPDGGLDFVTRAAPSAADGARLADAWEDRAGVLAAEVDGRVRLLATDTHRSRQWGLDRLRAEQAWPAGDGAGTVVAVLDTGVDGAHVDLAGQVLPPIDLVEPTATRTVSIDPQGHGTHVAGVVAATTGNGLGVAGFAPRARVLPVRVLEADGSGSDAVVAEGIVRAVDAGADVLNLSLGGRRRSTVLETAVRYALGNGVVVVAAAGNSGAGGGVEYPAGFSGVLGVAATTTTDALAWFSTTGSHVDLAAPGQDVLSTYPGDRLAELDGTSMAAPFVSGAAALLVSGGLPRAGVADRLVATAQDLGPAGRDDGFGHGLVDVHAARGTTSTPTSSPTTDAPVQAAPQPAPAPTAEPAPAPTAEPTQAPTQAPAPEASAPPSPDSTPSSSPSAAPEASASTDPTPSSDPTPTATAPTATAPASPSPTPDAARTTASPAPVLGARISVSTRALVVGQPVTVAARALRDGRGAAGVPVRLERSTGGAWSTVRTGTSGSNGLVSWVLRPDRTGVHRVRVGSGTSPQAAVAVRQRVTVAATRSVAAGVVRPGGRATVVLERRTSRGWLRVARVATAADGRYRARVRLPAGAVVRAVVTARPGLLSATTPAVRVR